MTTLNEFLLYARFKGELPPKRDDYKPPHWCLFARAMYALGDAEEKSEATDWLTEEYIEPDDELVYRLLDRWHEELFGAPHHFSRQARTKAKRRDGLHPISPVPAHCPGAPGYRSEHLLSGCFQGPRPKDPERLPHGSAASVGDAP